MFFVNRKGDYLQLSTHILLIVLIVINGITYAQTGIDFESWKKNDRDSENKFITKDNATFAEFLKKDWKAYHVYQSIAMDTVPKPTTVPMKEKIDKIRTDLSKTTKIRKIVNIPAEKSPQPTHEMKQYSHTAPVVVLHFYGQVYPLPDQKAFHLQSNKPIDNRYIGQAWQQFSGSDYARVMGALHDISAELALNDWGYVVLLNDYCEILFDDVNNKYLFMWYILLHSGYDAKVGYSKNNIVLMLSMKNDLYGTQYLPLSSGAKYYIYPFDNSKKIILSIYTYTKNFGDNLQPVDLAFFQPPLFPIKRFEKQLQFQYGKESILVNVNSNINLIRYLNRVPQADLKIYFRHDPDNELRKSITNSLRKYIVGKSEGEAANLLLRFVQKSQGYETDEQQFHAENYLFPEETIYYKYSDCEDRAILYAYLIREMLGLEVVGLDYPGHIATGVNFTSTIHGDAIRYHNKRYLICDPTYINADIGQSMPDFKQVPPKIIIF